MIKRPKEEKKEMLQKLHHCFTHYCCGRYSGKSYKFEIALFSIFRKDLMKGVEKYSTWMKENIVLGSFIFLAVFIIV